MGYPRAYAGAELNMGDAIEEEAARWYAAQDDDSMDWAGFTDWLGADPRHRAAFDAVALLGDAIDTHRAEIARRLDALPANDNASAQSRRGWWAAGTGGAAAVALALALALAPWNAAPTMYKTAKGEIRTVALNDGSRITIAPSSSLTISGKEQTEIALEGSAYFAVPHRQDRALTVHSAGIDIRDIGTRFAIAGDANIARVEVAEGKVSVGSEKFAAPIQLDAGHALLADRAASNVHVGPVDPQSVGSWRHGQLRYANAPLALVAADIGRYAGKSVTIDPALHGRRFSGVLTIGDGSTLASTLGAIMEIDVHEDSGGIRLSLRP
ncbi:FecR family protein [soil metagenome]